MKRYLELRNMEIKNLEGINKKSLPLNVVQFLNNLVDLQEPEISVVKDESYVWLVEDIDETSNFFFGIDTIHVHESLNKADEYSFGLTFRPASVNNLHIATRNISVKWEDLKTLFDNWLDRVRTFENTPFFINSEDKKLVQYKEEFINQMPFSNEDGTDYFDLETQVKIDKYLDDTIILLEEFKNEENSNSIDEIIDEVKELKSDQTKLNKQAVREKISKIWAKCRGLSLVLGQEVSKGIIVDLIKGLIIGS